MISRPGTQNDANQFGWANIPFGVVSTLQDPVPRPATRLFDNVFQLETLAEAGLIACNKEVLSTFSETSLNKLASLGRAEHRALRNALIDALQKLHADQAGESKRYAIDVADVRYHLPVVVGDFSDFSCSRDHVLNAGEAVQGIRQYPPGFLHFPVGYGGRSSSILPPGSPVRRPLGQFRTPEGIWFGTSRALDFELELACVIGKPSTQSHPVRIDDAEDHIFGFLLLNDWSARDIQGLEMNPLGPFCGKSLGTSISPWIVTADSLATHRVAGGTREQQPAPYLCSTNAKPHYAIQLNAEIEIEGERNLVCQSRSEWLYWTIDDMIAHQTINGCPLNAGDLLATGTVSGNHKGSHGCLLEATRGGKEPLQLQSGVLRTYLQDGDAVRLTGWAGSENSEDCVGFGECYGQIMSNEFADRY